MVLAILFSVGDIEALGLRAVLHTPIKPTEEEAFAPEAWVGRWGSQCIPWPCCLPRTQCGQASDKIIDENKQKGSDGRDLSLF